MAPLALPPTPPPMIVTLKTAPPSLTPKCVQDPVPEAMLKTLNNTVVEKQQARAPKMKIQVKELRRNYELYDKNNPK